MLLLDKELCVGCGACEECCPFAAIEMVGQCPQIGEECTLCGTCVDACGVSALSIKRKKRQQTDFSQWKGIAVFCEFRNKELAEVSLELLGEGRKLADIRNVPLLAIVIGFGLNDTVQRLIGYGADTVYTVDSSQCEKFREDVYAQTMCGILSKVQPEIVLAGATAIGRSFIPAVAVQMRAGLTADCTALAIREEDGALLQTRPAFGGNIMATIVCENTRPQMATVRPKVMRPLNFDGNRTGEIVPFDFAELFDGESVITVTGSVKSEDGDVNIQEADILIGGGRGVESAEGFALLEELAELLGGKVSASRAAVDAGWISYPHQVGQTGKTVAPKFYIACGISGAVQHIAGMSSAETIIAINRDKNAPIFDIADYGIVGNIDDVLPKLIDKIKERKA